METGTAAIVAQPRRPPQLAFSVFSASSSARRRSSFRRSSVADSSSLRSAWTRAVPSAWSAATRMSGSTPVPSQLVLLIGLMARPLGTPTPRWGWTRRKPPGCAPPPVVSPTIVARLRFLRLYLPSPLEPHDRLPALCGVAAFAKRQVPSRQPAQAEPQGVEDPVSARHLRNRDPDLARKVRHGVDSGVDHRQLHRERGDEQQRAGETRSNLPRD